MHTCYIKHLLHYIYIIYVSCGLTNRVNTTHDYIYFDFIEPSDLFTADDPFKSDPFAQFKTVSFADPFSSDPFEVIKVF